MYIPNKTQVISTKSKQNTSSLCPWRALPTATQQKNMVMQLWDIWNENSS